MANGKEKVQGGAVAEESKLPNSGETKVKFLVWFTECMDRFEKVKPHHMSGLVAYFKQMGLSDPNVPAKYDEAMKKYGYRLKGKK
jgi:hypothetical protein